MKKMKKMKKMKNLLSSIVLLILALLLVKCANLGDSSKDTRSYCICCPMCNI
jgi:hypothetical protein